MLEFSLQRFVKLILKVLSLMFLLHIVSDNRESCRNEEELGGNDPDIDIKRESKK